MRSTATFFLSRRFLQVHNASAELTSQPPDSSSASSSSAATSADGSMTLNPTAPFDSSMALTILVLLTALFFMGFFSVYIRRFATAEDSSSSPPSSRAPPQQQRQKRGLDPSAVSSLPLAAYGKATKHPMIDDCPICLGEFDDRETVKVIPYCGHVFHPRCVDTWLTAHATCPLCRTAQLFKSAEEDLEEGSAVREKDTWREESSGGGVRRACSCSQLGNPAVLQRTASF